MTSMEPSDAELLQRSATDRRAFGVFYERHERSVLGFLGGATRSADLAADLTAETFAAALESVERFDPARGTPSLWLFGIARNVLASSARRGRWRAGRVAGWGCRCCGSSLSSWRRSPS